MGKKVKPTQKQKQEYILTLKGSKTTYYKSKIQADFSPSKNISNIPTYNKDNNYYTPSFIIPSIFITTDINYQQEHQNKILATAEKSQSNIFVPKPKPKKNYCGVCSEEYQDYLSHVCSMKHKAELRSSKFYLQISNLCQKFKSIKETSKTVDMDRICSKNTIASQIQEEDSATKQSISKIQADYEHCSKLVKFKDQLYL